MSSKLLGIISLFLLFSCTNKSVTHTGFKVKGTIKNNTESTVTLSELTTQGLVLLDTATVNSDGTFEFSGNVSEKTFAIINLPKGAVALLLDSVADITLSIDATQPEVYGVAGSADSEELKKLLQINNTYMQQVRNLETKYASMGTEVPSVTEQNRLRAEYDTIMKKRSEELKAFALTNTESLVPYFLTNFLMPEADFAFFNEVDKRLFERFSSSKYAQMHHQRVETLRKTAEGEAAPDIVMNDPYGKTIALSSMRGKYILVDFWASWCQPCRMESPNLVRMYNTYKSKGFDIYSVSLDDNRDAWVKAINDDKLLWTHVSDLQKWNSSVVSQYNIEGIPFAVLLDKDGKIIAKNLRGKALEDQLKQIFR
ncbi:MAG: thioredoxin-like domain-containing protein [Bacteroidota bacterium]